MSGLGGTGLGGAQNAGVSPEQMQEQMMIKYVSPPLGSRQ